LATVQVIIESLCEIQEMLSFCSTSSLLKGDVVALAIGLAAQVNDPKFRIIAHMMLTVLSTLNPANIMLQSDSIDLVDGIALVESGKKQLSDMRKDDSDAFKMIWEKSGLNADSVNNSGVHRRRSRWGRGAQAPAITGLVGHPC
jgi:hypothetical protein